MGWNGSGKTVDVPRKASSKRNTKFARLLLCTIIFSILVILFIKYGLPALTYITSVHDVEDNATRSNMIPEVGLSMVKNNSHEQILRKIKERNELQGPRVQLDKDDLKEFKTVQLERHVITNKVSIVKDPIEVFNHRSEVELAFLACTPIGTPVIGSRDFDEDFMDDLRAALDEKIEILPDDSDETVYYKKTVIELKEEIQELMRDGEDVAKILQETRDELQELGVYKSEIEIMVNRVSSSEELSDNDMEDLVGAANAMLAEKGIEPLHFNKITRTIMRQKPQFDNDNDDEGDSDEE